MAPSLDFIDFFPEPLLAISPKGSVVRANAAAAACFGYKADELAGRSLFELVDIPAEQLRDYIKQWSSGSAFVPGVLRFRNRAGAVVSYLCEGARYAPSVAHAIVLLRLRPRDDANKKFGELTKQVVVLEAEVARRLRAEQRLLEVDKRKDEFLATLAHELRNPLAPLMNSLQLLKLAENPATILERYRAMMERQVKQLTRLVDDLLEVSRWTRGSIELRPEVVSLASIVRDAVSMSEPLIASRNQFLELKLPPQDLRVHGDPSRLVQALSNLLNNAAKYTPPGGRVGVFVEAREQEVVLRVTDSGIGIPPSMLTAVFELFVRADNSLERESEGLGIGLTLTKQIIAAHGGTIAAKSEGEGRGSEFVVRLPRHVEPIEPRLGEESATVAMRRRVLVVDDNRDAADSITAVLETFGHEVRVAYGGMEAISAAALFEPDAVILDIGMPGMSGYDVCRQLRGLYSNRIRVVALTGFGQQSDRALAFEAGFDDHVVKPVSVDDLQRLLSKAKPASP